MPSNALATINSIPGDLNTFTGGFDESLFTGLHPADVDMSTVLNTPDNAFDAAAGFGAPFGLMDSFADPMIGFDMSGSGGINPSLGTAVGFDMSGFSYPAAGFVKDTAFGFDMNGWVFEENVSRINDDTTAANKTIPKVLGVPAQMDTAVTAALLEAADNVSFL